MSCLCKKAGELFLAIICAVCLASPLALAAEVISVKAFYPIAQSDMDRAKKLIDSCDQVICTLNLENLGDYGEKLKELYEYSLNK